MRAILLLVALVVLCACVSAQSSSSSTGAVASSSSSSSAASVVSAHGESYRTLDCTDGEVTTPFTSIKYFSICAETDLGSGIYVIAASCADNSVNGLVLNYYTNAQCSGVPTSTRIESTQCQIYDFGNFVGSYKYACGLYHSGSTPSNGGNSAVVSSSTGHSAQIVTATAIAHNNTTTCTGPAESAVLSVCSKLGSTDDAAYVTVLSCDASNIVVEVFDDAQCVTSFGQQSFPTNQCIVSGDDVSSGSFVCGTSGSNSSSPGGVVPSSSTSIIVPSSSTGSQQRSHDMAYLAFYSSNDCSGSPVKTASIADTACSSFACAACGAVSGSGAMQNYVGVASCADNSSAGLALHFYSSAQCSGTFSTQRAPTTCRANPAGAGSIKYVCTSTDNGLGASEDDDLDYGSASTVAVSAALMAALAMIAL